MHESASASAFFVRERAHIAGAARLGPVLDLACGRGRHALACAELGLRTLALDRDAAALRAVQAAAADRELPLATLRADVETEHGIPIKSSSCGVILVFRFLFRPLAPALAAALAPGGLLLYETFTTAQRTLGSGPRHDAFLLEPGELRTLFPGLEVLDYWEGRTPEPSPEFVARLAARRVR